MSWWWVEEKKRMRDPNRCWDCKDKPIPGKKRCEPCLMRNRERTKARELRRKAEGLRFSR